MCVEALRRWSLRCAQLKVKKTVLVPPDGNTLVAYSTVSSHRAHETEADGVYG